MVRKHVNGMILGTLVATTALLAGCAEEPDVSCGEDGCAVRSCEYICAQVYDGCDQVFKTDQGLVASPGECVVACNQGYFTRKEESCLSKVYCGELDLCFEDGVPELPLGLLYDTGTRPWVDAPQPIHPGGGGDDGGDLIDSRDEAAPSDATPMWVPVEQRRPQFDPPGEFVPVPGEPSPDGEFDPRDAYPGA